MTRWQLGMLVVSVGCSFACSNSSDGAPADTGNGGTTPTGGASASGGATASGGASTSGGAGATSTGGGTTINSGGSAGGGGASGGAANGGTGASVPDASVGEDAAASGGTAGGTGGAPVTPGTPASYAPCGVPGPACPGVEECRSLQSLGLPVIVNIGIACGADAGAYGCWCAVPCSLPADCPAPPGGAGEPFCSAGFCRLLCNDEAGQPCPSGMRCTRFPEAQMAQSLCDWPP